MIHDTRMLQYFVYTDTTTAADTLSHLSPSLLPLPPPPSLPPQSCFSSPLPTLSLDLPILDHYASATRDYATFDEGEPQAAAKASDGDRSDCPETTDPGDDDEDTSDQTQESTSTSAAGAEEDRDDPREAGQDTSDASVWEDPYEESEYASVQAFTIYSDTSDEPEPDSQEDSEEEGEEEGAEQSVEDTRDAAAEGEDETSTAYTREDDGAEGTTVDASARSSNCHWCHKCRGGPPCDESEDVDDLNTNTSDTRDLPLGMQDPAAQYASEKGEVPTEADDDVIQFTRDEIMDHYRAIVRPKKLPLYAIECLMSLMEMHLFLDDIYDMAEDLGEDHPLVLRHFTDLEVILAKKASAIRRAARGGLPLRAVMRQMRDETGTLVLPFEPCVLAALGAMRGTLEDERADCFEELSTIDNPFTYQGP